MTALSAILVLGGAVYAFGYWLVFGAVPREIQDVLDGGWRCLDCGRVRHRDDVFIHDAGPICRDRIDCQAAMFEDDQDDYEPYRDDKGATA